MNAAAKARASAEEKGLIKERTNYLSLAPKNGAGVPTPNGPHTIKLISDEIVKDATGVQKLQVTVEEGGVEKLWNINLKDNEGNLHYLVETLSHIEVGSTIVVEMMNRNGRNFVQVTDPVDQDKPSLDSKEEDF
jgi:hypothetical protein